MDKVKVIAYYDERTGDIGSMDVEVVGGASVEEIGEIIGRLWRPQPRPAWAAEPTRSNRPVGETQVIQPVVHVDGRRLNPVVEYGRERGR